MNQVAEIGARGAAFSANAVTFGALKLRAEE